MSRAHQSLQNYVVVLTKNSSYHISNGVCVGVWSQVNRCWQKNHPISGQKLLGCILDPTTWKRAERPTVGGGLWFRPPGSDNYVTSRILNIRPPTSDEIDACLGSEDLSVDGSLEEESTAQVRNPLAAWVAFEQPRAPSTPDDDMTRTQRISKEEVQTVIDAILGEIDPQTER